MPKDGSQREIINTILLILFGYKYFGNVRLILFTQIPKGLYFV